MSSCCPYTVASFTNTVPLDTLMRHIMPMVPSAPHAMVLDRVRQAYTDFARRSGIVVAKLTQDIQTNVHDYSLDAPDGYEIYMVLGLDSPGFSFVDYWRGCKVGLWGTQFDVVDNRSIYIHRAPSVDVIDGLSVYVSLLPNSCTNLIPQSIATPFGKGITQGALADLLLMPNKPWSSAQIAGMHKIEFNRTVQAAKNLAESNRQPGPIRIKKLRVI